MGAALGTKRATAGDGRFAANRTERRIDCFFGAYFGLRKVNRICHRALLITRSFGQATHATWPGDVELTSRQAPAPALSGPEPLQHDQS